MAAKAPRRTKERILDAALELFNRFGEPNVSTPVVAQALGISPGNLHYHYRAKEELVNALFDRYAASLCELLHAADGVGDVEDAWFFLHTLFERLWGSRFLYRDINDLLSRNRKLETEFRQLLLDKTRAVRAMLDGMARAGSLSIDTGETQATAESMVVVLTWWLSFEYVHNPRHALEPEAAQQSLLRGAHHVLHLLVPYLEAGQRRHLRSLAGAYGALPDAGT